MFLKGIPGIGDEFPKRCVGSFYLWPLCAVTNTTFQAASRIIASLDVQGKLGSDKNVFVHQLLIIQFTVNFLLIRTCRLLLQFLALRSASFNLTRFSYTNLLFKWYKQILNLVYMQIVFWLVNFRLKNSLLFVTMLWLFNKMVNVSTNLISHLNKIYAVGKDSSLGLEVPLPPRLNGLNL